MKLIYTIKILVTFIISSSFIKAQTRLNGFVVDESNRPIENVYVFNEEDLNEFAITDKEGKFSFNNETSAVPKMIILSHTAYNVEYAEFKHNQKYYLAPFSLPLLEIGDEDRVHKLIENIEQAYKNNAPSTPSFYKVFLDNATTSNEKSVLIFKGDFDIMIPTYQQNEFYNIKIDNINAQINQRVKRIEQFVSYNFPIYPSFFLDQINYSIYEFIKRPKHYSYFLTETEDKYQLHFQPKKEREFSYKGFATVNKKDYSIEYLKMDMVPNQKNYFNIISIPNKSEESITHCQMLSIELYYKDFKINKINGEIKVKQHTFENVIPYGMTTSFEFTPIKNNSSMSDDKMYKYFWIKYKTDKISAKTMSKKEMKEEIKKATEELIEHEN